MTTYTINCDYCKADFQRTARLVAANKCNENKNLFCSKACCSAFYDKTVQEPCANCDKQVIRTLAERKKTKNVFCNRSCAATYNNKHKEHGNRRSKLELYLEQQTKAVYPELKFLLNSKETIGSELDFYFPDLKLAIEINGIFHYEPIYGLDKLSKIQKNDLQKFKVCHEAGIELCTIASLDGYMKKEVLEKYWKQFQALLLSKMAPGE